MAQNVPPFSHSLPRWNVATYLRTKDKSVGWKRSGGYLIGEMKKYGGIEIVRDTSHYCAMNNSRNILYGGGETWMTGIKGFKQMSDLLMFQMVSSMEWGCIQCST